MSCRPLCRRTLIIGLRMSERCYGDNNSEEGRQLKPTAARNKWESSRSVTPFGEFVYISFLTNYPFMAKCLTNRWSSTEWVVHTATKWTQMKGSLLGCRSFRICCFASAWFGGAGRVPRLNGAASSIAVYRVICLIEFAVCTTNC